MSLVVDAARRRVFATALVAFLAASGAWDRAGAEDVCPPGLGNDGCERWLFGRADEELAAVLVSGTLALAGKANDLLADPDVGRLFLGG